MQGHKQCLIKWQREMSAVVQAHKEGASALSTANGRGVLSAAPHAGAAPASSMVCMAHRSPLHGYAREHDLQSGLRDAYGR
eukprot:scaffold2099_cov401-Prasinococcus_capsulatus_cf.AAC.2